MFVSCPGHGQVIRFKMWDNSFGYNSAPAQAWGTSYNARSYALPTYRNSRLLGTSNGYSELLKLNDFNEMSVPAARTQLLKLTDVASSLCLAS